MATTPQFLVSAPPGFRQACLSLNKFPTETLIALALDTAGESRSPLDFAEISKTIVPTNPAVTAAVIQSCHSALLYILTSTIQYNLTAERRLSPKSLAQLLGRESLLSSKAASVLTHCWEGALLRQAPVVRDHAGVQAADHSEMLAALAGTGRLVGVKWDLALGLARSMAAEGQDATMSDRPEMLVRLVLDIDAGVHAPVQRIPLELSLPEFRSFAAHIKQLGGHFDIPTN
ncbi:hypothetical protein H696_00889 [Fonticula alba]|uniref:COMM domain-containing protein n=1 Tax=Fonticula alba TaxID=691883 RepID=A0A058ZG28_FONAL|nr:hypothetical protein H696_00889 [Fonticula alba]KCV73350.1 hypothetical protein H696_00889 [Fonticula alba]|eukprot:XP_009493051.1 hypothetical protein H696_00889 [Fonticula alba]